MLINSSVILRGVRAEYNRAFAEMSTPANRIYEPCYTEIQSNGKDEKYAWLGAVPGIIEWLGPKKAKGLGDFSYTITNKNFEGTLEVDRNEVEDDQMNAIIPRVKMLAQRAVEFPSKLVSQLIIAGDSGLAYDGQAFFANRSTNDNLLAGTGTSLAQFETDLAAARATMLSFVDDSGEPMGLIGNVLVVPPALELVARKVVYSTTAAGQSNPGVNNPFNGLIERVIVDPRMSDANDWYLLATGMPLKPFVFQNRRAPTFVALDRDTDRDVFMNRKYIFGVEMRCNAGYGFYQMAVKTVNA